MIKTEELIYLVKHKEKLPSVGTTIEIQNVFSGDVKEFKVKKISDLRWNSMGDLVITMSGNYKDN